MRLDTLFSSANLDFPPGLAHVAAAGVVGVTDDSRRVQPGWVYVARRPAGRTDADALGFARAAADAGALVVVSGSDLRLAVPSVKVDSAAASFGKLAHAFAGNPSKGMRLFGVTGTNGKTTCAYLVQHVLARAKIGCGLIGTVEVDDGAARRPSDMTTPGAAELAELFTTMRARGLQACAMEVSSHALDQKRTAGLDFHVAGFTNLTGDHLDYHGTMEAYAGAKAALYADLCADSVAVVNGDDRHFPRMIDGCKGRVVRFGAANPNVEYRAQGVQTGPAGSGFTLRSRFGEHDVRLRLVGLFNVQNALLALATAVEGYGVPIDDAIRFLSDADGAPGRLQRVTAGDGSAPVDVYVDYAHTDDALSNVLRALRPLTRGRLRVVFGCGGDRDRTKRPRMARVAAELADELYVTSDNPRSEEPEAILEDIFSGLDADSSRRARRIADRRRAIACAIGESDEGDAVLIAGKGHEDYQLVRGERRPFDDAEEARRALAQGTDHARLACA